MGYLETVQDLSGQIEQAASITINKLPKGDFNKILVSGMGGSSIAGAILKSYMANSKIPVFISRDYDLPEFIDSKTLVFSISYSGNTEETLSALRTAHRKGCGIVAIASGGKLLQKFREMTASYIEIPSGMQPRASLAYQLIPMLNVLASLNLIPDPSNEIKKTVVALNKPSFNTQAEALASKIVGKVPIIYASERFASVAYRWKTQFNENCKIHAFSNTFSELNHNEIVGYENLNGNYYVVVLEDEDDHKRIKARMKLTRDVISRKQVPSTHIVIRGDTVLTRLFSAIHIGDLTSVHLALLTNTDPVPVDIIENFKKRLEKIPAI